MVELACIPAPAQAVAHADTVAARPAPPGAALSPRYRSAARVHVLAWSVEAGVAYAADHGTTHLLDALALGVWRLLDSRGATDRHALAQRLGIADDAEVDRVLRHLVARGLVAHCDEAV